MYPKPLTDRGQIARLEAALDRVFLSTWPRSDPAVVQAVENEVFRRYNQSVRFGLPWVDRVAPLAGKEVVEIGCGSGSSTAAFAHLAGRVYAYDIVPHLIQATRARAEVLGLKNITCDLVPAQAPLDELRRRHAGGVDFVLLYALLEHCTSTECLETLRTGWELLRPGGHLVVIETPNRFTYLDYHTSFQPLFHLLPRSIALRYFDRIPRALVKEELSRALEQSEEAASLSLTRLGIGIGYQEFQLGLGQDDLGKLLAADGFEPEMMEHFPPTLEERLLQTFFLEQRVDAPIGFSRVVLNLMFRKPLGALPEKALIDPASRAHLLVNYARNTDEVTLRQARLFQEFGESKVSRLVITPKSASELQAVNHATILPQTDRIVLRSTGNDPIVLLPAFRANGKPLVLMADVTAPETTYLGAFYSSAAAPGFAQERSVHTFVHPGRNQVFLELPAGVTGRVRLDPGETPGDYHLHRLEIRERC